MLYRSVLFYQKALSKLVVLFWSFNNELCNHFKNIKVYQRKQKTAAMLNDSEMVASMANIVLKTAEMPLNTKAVGYFTCNLVSPQIRCVWVTLLKPLHLEGQWKRS